MQPKVTLLSWTKDVLETLWMVWQTSRSNEPLDVIVRQTDFNDKQSFANFFKRIIYEDIPISEMVDFVFLLENVSISLREQLVRHRIGVKVGPGLGVDQIPDLADSSFWSQSMRILDMSLFATKEQYLIPESIGQNQIAKAIYQTQMQDAQASYRSLAGLGIPLEDARQVIPLGTTHRLVWKLNLASLKKIVGKRGCWILQLGLWKPIIMGMIDELCSISPEFRELVAPPCISQGNFQSCHFCQNNLARIEGSSDEIPPCPLFMVYCTTPEHKGNYRWKISSLHTVTTVSTIDRNAAARFLKMCNEYFSFWGGRYFSFSAAGVDSQSNEVTFEIKQQ
jgi:thymidylate synthase (FAD)